MRRIKVYNMIFMNASYSFSFLRMYYEHVVALFNQSYNRAQEIRARMKAEYESKGREYDNQTMKEFHKVFDEVYPGYFHNSFLVTACSLFEHEVKRVWGFIEEEHHVLVTWDDIKGPVPVRMQQLLNLAGVPLKDDPPRIELSSPNFKPVEVYDRNRIGVSTLWEDLKYCYRLRNCIVHNNGLVHKARGSESIAKYANEKGVLVEKEGQWELTLNESFNVAVCYTMGTFFDKLMSAYYSTPLPKESD